MYHDIYQAHNSSISEHLSTAKTFLFESKKDVSQCGQYIADTPSRPAWHWGNVCKQ